MPVSPATQQVNPPQTPPDLVQLRVRLLGPINGPPQASSQAPSLPVWIRPYSSVVPHYSFSALRPLQPLHLLELP